MILQEPLQAAIWHCLNHYAYSDAIFLAERLHADYESEESVYLLGTCYYRSGRKNEAFWLLSNSALSSPNAKFLLAKCALDLQKLSDAEATLNTVEADFGDSSAFGLQLLGRLYGSTERRERAAEAYRKSLSLNPFLWESFAQLCRLGEKVKTDDIFQLSNTKNLSQCLGTVPPFGQAVQENATMLTNCALNSSLKVTPGNNIVPQTLQSLGGITPDGIASAKKLRSVFGGATAIPFSPSDGILPLEDSPLTHYTSTLTDANEQKALPKLVHSLRASVGHLRESMFSPAPRQAHMGALPHVRRSSRLFSNNYSVKENNKSPNRKFAAPKSPLRKNKPRVQKNILSKSTINEATENRTQENIDKNPAFNSALIQAQPNSKQNFEGWMNLFKDFGDAFFHLASLDCKRAIHLFEKLPPRQHRSPWVQTMLALSHHELGEYDYATKYFAEVRKMQPYRTEFLDIYSTCLWHLQKEVDLSALAHELVKRDRQCATAWIVAGNCFSLHKEHDTAIKYFRRAVQLKPNRSYAHTLLGHEYVATEETDKAMACFRNAVRLDPRHYNAWFGIATVYSKQERFKLAEIHFKRALAIHPESGVLRCHLGVVQVALGKSDKALTTLDHAVTVDPKNPLCRFHRASVLFSSGRLTEALKELEDLKDLVPKESLVYYLLGKVHNKLGNSHLALMHFSWATDLDPKGASGHIKEAFDPTRSDDPPEPAL